MGAAWIQGTGGGDTYGLGISDLVDARSPTTLVEEVSHSFDTVDVSELSVSTQCVEMDPDLSVSGVWIRVSWRVRLSNGAGAQTISWQWS